MQSKSNINPNHEIDIAEIWNATVKHWKLIGIITAVFGLIAILYLSVTPKIYKSTATLTSANLSELNKLDNGLDLLDLSQDKAFKELYRILTQADLQFNFHKKHIFSETEQNLSIAPAFNNFQKKLTISNTSKKNTFKSIEMSYISSNPDLSSQILKQFVNEANEKLNSVYIDNYNAKLTSAKRQIQRLIDELTNTANQEAEIEIYQLKEAIDIAKALNIATPASSTSFNNLVLDGSLNSQSIPLYSLGYEALELRVKSIENRENNGLFIEGYTTLKAQLDALNSITPPKEKLTLFSYEQTPFSHPTPIKPKPALILSLALLLGFMIGMLAAIIKYFNHIKQKQNENTPNQPVQYSNTFSTKPEKAIKDTELQV
jgi:LPS O-antigen subunit length determinant protein (WzzB/FepE family)